MLAHVLAVYSTAEPHTSMSTTVFHHISEGLEKVDKSQQVDSRSSATSQKGTGQHGRESSR